MIRLILAPLLGWIISHTLKVLIFMSKNKRFEPSLLHKAGGMPSGHSATVTALSLALYLEQGLTPLIVITVVFSILVIRDTMLRPKEYKHKPIEVLAGILLGAIIAYILYFI